MQRLPFDITELWKDPLKLANTPRPANRRSTSNLGHNFGVGEPAFRQAVVIKNGGRIRYEQSILGTLKSLFSFPPPWLIAPCPGYFCSLFWPGKPDSLITFISLHCKVTLIQIKYLTLLKFRVCVRHTGVVASIPLEAGVKPQCGNSCATIQEWWSRMKLCLVVAATSTAVRRSWRREIVD